MLSINGSHFPFYAHTILWLHAWIWAAYLTPFCWDESDYSIRRMMWGFSIPGMRGMCIPNGKMRWSLPSNRAKGKVILPFWTIVSLRCPPLLWKELLFYILLRPCNPVHVFVMPPQQVKPSSSDIICWIIHKTQRQILNPLLWRESITLTATNTYTVVRVYYSDSHNHFQNNAPKLKIVV